MASFRILGPVQAFAVEDEVALGGRRQLTLLAFLLLHANRAVSTDALTEAVWGPARPAGDNRLTMAIGRLRKALEPLNSSDGARLRTVTGGYLLTVDAGELDAAVFIDRVRAGRAALDVGDLDGAVEQFASALSLWRGPALAEVAFEDFAQPEIRRLDELRLTALESRIDAELRLGRHAQLVGELEALVGEHPTREHFAGELMLALYRAGRQADALEVYQRIRMQLAAELGLDPGPALNALQAQILQHAPELELASLDGNRGAPALTGSRAGARHDTVRPVTSRELPAGTVTFLFAEAEESTLLLRDLGSERYAVQLGRLRDRVREIVSAHGGWEFDGDREAFAIAFARASDAVSAAGELQAMFAEEHLPVRIGIHTGEPLVLNDDYVGLDVNKAAQICAAAHGGQVVLSQATRELVDAEVCDLGEYRLNDLPGPERLFQLGAREFPSLAATRASTLPPQPGQLIDRDEEVERVCQLLGDPTTRLVTLIGPGGVGKTRLALAVAHTRCRSMPDGAYWVELAGVGSPADVEPTIARALDVTTAAGESTRAALSRHLARKRALVVLDNFEHVLDAAEAVPELLRSTSGLRLLVTSREALRLSAEERVTVAPLGLPDDRQTVSVADVESAGATALFLDAARRRQPDIKLTPENAPVIARLCARLDGLPLALELAAARAEFLGIGELAQRLASVADLGSGPRDAPARQRTLSATIDWSYRLLDEQQRSAFTRFSVFAGGATIDAAAAVTGASLEVLEALCAKSLLNRRAAVDGTSRLVMLETVREYAAELLESDPASDAVHRNHAQHYHHIVKQAATRLATRAQADALAEIDHDIDNVRVALRWLLANAPGDALRLAGALGDYWSIRGDPDGLDWLDQALRAGGTSAPRSDRALGQLKRTRQLWLRGRFDDAAQAAREALELERVAGDHAACSTACFELTLINMQLGEVRAARAFSVAAHRYARLAGDPVLIGKALGRRAWYLPVDLRMAVLDQARDLLAQAGDDRAIAVAYGNVGWAFLKEDRLADARRLLDIALRAAFRADSPETAMYTLANLGWAYLFTDNYRSARAAFTQQLQLCIGHNYQYGADDGLVGLAILAARDMQGERAAKLRGAARALGWPTADQAPRILRLEEQYFAPLRARYGPTRWRQAEQDGAALSYDEAITYALQPSSTAHTSQATTATHLASQHTAGRASRDSHLKQPTQPRPRGHNT